MRLVPICDRLRGGSITRVEGALELAAIDERPGALPAWFVVPATEAAGENRLGTGAIDQKVVTEFIVALMLNASARGDGKVSDQLHELSEATIERLLGWTPPGAKSPITFAGASLAGVRPGQLTWAMRFRCSHHLRKTG